MVILRLFD